MIKIFLYFLSKAIKKVQIASIRDSKIDKTARVCPGANVIHSQLGKYSYIGNNTTVVHTTIGRFCSIADYCSIGNYGHPTDWVSTSPVMYAGKNILGKNFSENEYKEDKTTKIGNDVWIGGGCHIKSGVTIADGAVIGMGSVVTHDVPSYEIWAGNPAKLIKKRFDDDTIQRLKDLKWWDFPEEKIEKYAEHFNDPAMFIRRINEEEQ